MSIDLLEGIEHWARVTPDRPAHETGGRTLTYGGLWSAANAVGGAIAALGLAPTAPIVVRGHKEPEMLIGFAGALLAGHPYIPVDSSVPESRSASIAELAGAALVLTTQEIERLGSSGPAPPRRERSVDDVQYVMFTSGSTGRPKGVPITRGNLAQFHRWLLADHGLAGSGDRFLDQAVYSFDLSVMSVYPSLTTGGTLVSLSADEVANPARLFRTLAAARPTVWVSTPTFAAMCLAERRFTASLLPDLRRFLFCGETLPPGTARSLLDRFPGAEIWNTYGPTETTVAVTSVRVDRPLLDRFNPLPIGRPGHGTQVAVVDESLEALPDGERGEILIAGPSVSPGYLNAPELTRQSFVRWRGLWAYRTGDWGHTEEGLIFFDGRKDDQVKLHGYRIELGDVEANLRGLPGVIAAAAVVGSTDGAHDSLVAFIVLESPGPARDFVRSLKASLAARLPRYMIPGRICLLDALPTTPNGKLDRRALAGLARSGPL